MSTKENAINKIGNEIKVHFQKEKNERVYKYAVGLSHISIGNNRVKTWLINGQIPNDRIDQIDVTGNIIAPIMGHTRVLRSDGVVVSKNSKAGGTIITTIQGGVTYQSEVGPRLWNIHDTSFYGHNRNLSQVIDIKIHFEKKRPAVFRSLQDLFNLVQTKSDDLEKLENEKRVLEEDNKRKEEIDKITKEIEQTKADQKDLFSKAQTFIRKNAELRYQPVLDPWQEEIKRSHIFDGYSLAINGGPGTGKTTSLIQRIKFLMEKEVLNEYRPDLSDALKEKVSQADSWIFFSPSELLKQFLKNNMSSEGLNPNDRNVLVWDDHKSVLMKRYKLFNPETQSPFLSLRKYEEKNMLPFNGKQLKQILKSFELYLEEKQNVKLRTLLTFDTKDYFWKETATSIKNYINRQEKDYTINGLIRLFFNLQETFTNEIAEIETTFSNDLKNAVGSVIYSIDSNAEIKNHVSKLLNEWFENRNSVEQEEDDLDETDEVIARTFNYEHEIYNKLRSLIRKVSLMKFDSSVKFSKRDKELNVIISRIEDLKDIEKIDTIGQGALFIKIFARFTKGVVTNVFRELPGNYKTFRKQELEKKHKVWNLEILDYVVNIDAAKNKRIHANEQAFLINYINILIKKCFKTSIRKTNAMKHVYLDAFKENSKPVIGVDEATDFHLIDLLAIKSLGSQDISSITFSGDLMQRLTNDGIRNWDEFKLFDKNFSTNNLEISYRQSPTLIEVAQDLYENATGMDAEYISYMDRDEKEPKPLYFESTNEHEKIEWIGQRILEIYRAYGNSIPSIAIFLTNESDLDDFASILGDIDQLADNDIKVKACKNGLVLGDSNTIRVFSIDFIKGLEFEAVFYHNIDTLYNRFSEEMILKNLYVGLSRATFYLGITSSKEDSSLTVIDKYFDQKSQW